MRGLQNGEAHGQDLGPTGLFHRRVRAEHLHGGQRVARTSFPVDSPTVQACLKADHQ